MDGESPSEPRSIFDQPSNPRSTLPARLTIRLPVVAAPVAKTLAAPPTTLDARLIEILERPAAAGEAASAVFHRKEAELGAVFATLTVLESRALHARLCNPRPGDVLADKFGRLTVERRNRLINFLADARRRDALAARR